jgi:FlaG/FlaF family flagellin (archaellin)
MTTADSVEKAKIVSWAFGGSRMALARVDQRSIEVWDSSSGAISVNR